MSTDNTLLRKPRNISSLDELETAKKRAEINAAQDKLRLQNNLNEIKREGPSVLLKNVVLPVVAIGVGVYGISKLIGSLTRNDERRYYYEPNFEEDTEYAPQDAKAPFRPARFAEPVKSRSLLTTLAAYGPLLIKVSKMGVDYLEKNGTKIPSVIHDLLASTDTEAEQTKV